MTIVWPFLVGYTIWAAIFGTSAWLLCDRPHPVARVLTVMFCLLYLFNLGGIAYFITHIVLAL